MFCHLCTFYHTGTLGQRKVQRIIIRFVTISTVAWLTVLAGIAPGFVTVVTKCAAVTTGFAATDRAICKR